MNQSDKENATLRSIYDCLQLNEIEFATWVPFEIITATKLHFHKISKIKYSPKKNDLYRYVAFKVSATQLTRAFECPNMKNIWLEIYSLSPLKTFKLICYIFSLANEHLHLIQQKEDF
jgi:hypothetical protein